MSIPRSYQGPIRLLLLDVDGVLTDGSLLLSSRGEDIKRFNVRDGLAVALLRAHQIQTGILSGKSSGALDFRIQQLGIELAVTGKLEKLSGLEHILERADLSAESVAYVGDDVVDLPLAGRVGAFYAPSDAHPLVVEKADYVLRSAGGHGAAREAAEHLLSLNGLSMDEIYAPLIGQWEENHAAQ